MLKNSWLLVVALLFAACSTTTDKEHKDQSAREVNLQPLAPDFVADSAYFFVAKQVAFGPRVPGSEAHQACGDWLEAKLNEYTDKVYVQTGKVTAYDGTVLNMRNLVGAFNPENPRRIVLCAHWDTRPFADQDEDKSRYNEPIDGADDGASGVGVLLEIARQLKEKGIDIGVDILLFDVEDYGQPSVNSGQPKADTYALGAQYWSKNPHIPGYQAKFGILLDMVGAKNAEFRFEGYSMQVAPTLVRKVWDIAVQLGHSRYFLFQETGPVQDDHFYMNSIAGIPTIDIIHTHPNGEKFFGRHWHTHDDNMDIIDPAVLDAVGQTVLEVVYQENAGKL